MHDISKHHSEEKWEGNAGEKGWVDLFVAWHTICINNLLEHSCELVGLEQSWFGQTTDFIRTLLHVQTLNSLHCHNLSNLLVELEGLWSPDEALENTAHLLKHVKMVVDCLLS